MIKSSKAVVLVLIGSVAVLWGFKSCVDGGYYANEGGGSTTQPGHSSGGGHYFWRSGSRSAQGSRGSHFRSSTSRGGFGSIGRSSGS